ncbi:MAG: ATP synthase F1 subunit gamma [Endomicrobium sp.]|jgi:F-type H+-transporting ATPase subunit gamma|nr:ATP synthase F1 subunit gamma [Endomicrobium sp.]
MQNLQQIKKRIKTTNSIAQISKAMEMISASKIRKVQSSVDRYNPYAKKIKCMVQKIIVDKDLADNVENSSKYEGNKLVYIISPDKGLCGGLIVNLFKKVNSYVKKSDYVVAIGKKAANNATKYYYNVLASFNMGTSFPKYDDIYPLINTANNFYVSKEVTKISIIYTEFKNIITQEAIINEIFPIKYDKNFQNHEKIDYIFEPNSKQVFKDLLPYYFEVEFYGALMNAYASEQAARMIAMKNAKDNASDISASLVNIYNKSRQEKITNEILDLANGQQGT